MKQLHMYLGMIIFLCSSSLLQHAITVNALGNETDRLALLELKGCITDDPHGILMRSWNDSIHFCNWPGITCSRRHGRVTALNLLAYDLRGCISPFISNLTFLRFIHLGNNSYFGEIPPEVGSLKRLQHLNLTNNMLSGKIPVSLVNCSELRSIDLTKNRLIGNIPLEFGSLMKLETLRISVNNLTGGIPPSLGNLSSISFKTFSAAYNNLVGNIPDEIGRLKSLFFFAAPANKLSGMIPPSLYNLSSISVISIAVNRINGSLPGNIGFSLPNLQTLDIYGNYFSGPIPISLCNASQLQVIDLGFNHFVGQVPMNLGNLQDLMWLQLGQNYLGSNSSNDLGFLTSLANCSKLDILDVNSNNFGGVLPDCLGNFSTQISRLIFEGNYICGSIPASLENLVNLNVLAMMQNLVAGSIPESLGKLQNLQILNLPKNRLSGEIPSSLSNLTKLIKFSISYNRLQGTIPPIFGNYKHLQELDISSNNLSGTIPLEVFVLPSLSIVLDLSDNSLTGSLPVEVGSLKQLGILDLSTNNLSGEIPTTIGQCATMEILFLANNLFHGNIPSSLSSMRGLVTLTVSQNNLSGEIPKEIQNLPFLTYLNISFNNLEGEVPRRGVFANASAIFLTGNSKLCGGIPELKLPVCPTKTKGSKARKLRIIVICVAVVVALALAVLFSLSFALYLKRKSGKKSSLTSLSRMEFLPKVSYRALFEATRGFSPNCLIGTGSFGSVYKATIDEEEKAVAVKVLNLERKGATKGFIAECKALRNIRHRNLVKIITACSSSDYKGNDFKALVLEFMENGSLEEWLHGGKEDGNCKQLNLPQRLNILLDVASALDYLHQQCEQPIIHCDIKPSNVLLDKDMVAHLSDFGLARLIVSNTTKGRFGHCQTSSTIGIKGSIGYTAPEYGMGGEASIEGDLYSYGILVLEILTARRPTDEVFKDGFNLHNFVKSSLPERLVQIVDPTLFSSRSDSQGETNNNYEYLMSEMDIANVEKSLISVLQIGVGCSVESPKERMKIHQVTSQLRLIINSFSS